MGKRLKDFCKTPKGNLQDISNLIEQKEKELSELKEKQQSLSLGDIRERFLHKTIKFKIQEGYVADTYIKYFYCNDIVNIQNVPKTLEGVMVFKNYYNKEIRLLQTDYRIEIPKEDDYIYVDTDIFFTEIMRKLIDKVKFIEKIKIKK